MVARSVLVACIGGVTAAGDERFQHAAQALFALHGERRVVVNGVHGATELARHLQTQLHGERFVGASDAQIAGFGVQQGLLGVSFLLLSEVFLPSVVGGHAVGNVAFQP